MLRLPYETGYTMLGVNARKSAMGIATPRIAPPSASVGWSTPRYIRASASPNTSTAIAIFARYRGRPGTINVYAIPISTTVSAATGKEGAE